MISNKIFPLQYFITDQNEFLSSLQRLAFNIISLVFLMSFLFLAAVLFCKIFFESMQYLSHYLTCQVISFEGRGWEVLIFNSS